MNKKEILEYYYPNYTNLEIMLDNFSTYELSLINDNLPEDCWSLCSTIINEVQWNIAKFLFNKYINNWDTFYDIYEDKIINICYRESFLTYDNVINAYIVIEDSVIDCCHQLIEDTDNYSIIDSVDINKVVDDLNYNFPVKFCKE